MPSPTQPPMYLLLHPHFIRILYLYVIYPTDPPFSRFRISPCSIYEPYYLVYPRPRPYPLAPRYDTLRSRGIRDAMSRVVVQRAGPASCVQTATPTERISVLPSLSLPDEAWSAGHWFLGPGTYKEREHTRRAGVLRFCSLTTARPGLPGGLDTYGNASRLDEPCQRRNTPDGANRKQTNQKRNQMYFYKELSQMTHLPHTQTDEKPPHTPRRR